MRAGYLLTLGMTPYVEAWNLQRSLAAAVSQGAIPDTVVLLEHPPVITVGRRTTEGEVHVPEGAEVEIAETREERQVGLMNRESLPEDAGMIFLFEADTDVGFWMKNTLIPLSIAFADDDGEIVAILDMEPCESEPCEIYDPGVPYRSALEVNQGAFESWGVAVGDRLRLDR